MRGWISIRICALGVLLAISALSARGDEQPVSLEALDGFWISKGMRNIIGAGKDEMLTFQHTTNGMELVRTTVLYPSVNEREKPVTRWSQSVSASLGSNGVLVCKGERTESYSMRFESEYLVLPAFVALDERTWSFVSPGKAGIFQCEKNPSRRNRGKASFPSQRFEGLEQFYTYDVKDGERELAFFDKLQDDRLYKRGKLTWGKYGSPHFDPQHYHHGFEQRRYERLGREAYEKIIASSTEVTSPYAGKLDHSHRFVP